MKDIKVDTIVRVTNYDHKYFPETGKVIEMFPNGTIQVKFDKEGKKRMGFGIEDLMAIPQEDIRKYNCGASLH